MKKIFFLFFMIILFSISKGENEKISNYIDGYSLSENSYKIVRVEKTVIGAIKFVPYVDNELQTIGLLYVLDNKKGDMLKKLKENINFDEKILEENKEYVLKTNKRNGTQNYTIILLSKKNKKVCVVINTSSTNSKNFIVDNDMIFELANEANKYIK